MRHFAKKAHYHATAVIEIVLLLVFSLRIDGQILHRTDYDIVPGRRSGGGVGGVASGGGNDDISAAGAGSSGDDENMSTQSNGIHTNGEILGPKSFPLSAQEPSCEELRAMWIFSKRQSRAAEISNEIPTYRDPFTYNVWDPAFPVGRGIGSRILTHYREPTRPVFGRVVSREPVVLQRLPVRSKIFDDIPSPKMYGSETRSAMPAVPNATGPRRYVKYRFSGLPYGNSQTNNQNLIHQGSFQKLKELIWTERAKELTQQRKAEELAARAAALKEIAAGQLINRYSEQNDQPLANEENLSPDQQGQFYQNNADSRIIIANNGQEPTPIKSIFSGNPSTSNSVRSGRLLIPSMTRIDTKNRGNVQRHFPTRLSHFRERNRVLFRQSTPSDLYQRVSRSELFDTLPSSHENLKKDPDSIPNDNITDNTHDDSNNANNHYKTIVPYLNSNNDLQQLSTHSLQNQQQRHLQRQPQNITALLRKLFQIDLILSSSKKNQV